MNERSKKQVLGLILLLFLSGCIFNVERSQTNSIEDKFDSEQIVKKFYSYQNAADIDQMLGMFSNEYIKQFEMQQLVVFLSELREQLGYLKHRYIKEWKTESGTNSSSVYFFVFENEYENGHTTETFHMRKEFPGRIRIVDYKVKRR
ncbi:hypothetical protein KDU71_01800 [Carboxylicivirga sediminis]|uniref:Uncharacterized protein n=1 Tax=Carboxylicivirga sediminis TaxID=2006564 RepID=A0A941F2Q3_9BACT|nr:hypothetical protein [Carboxylicivirga sediminis]MBR8534275.1 hypothetical protein [Carboxylicivirga sediminis]